MACGKKLHHCVITLQDYIPPNNFLMSMEDV